MNFASILGVSVFIMQHCYYTYYYKSREHVVYSLDDVAIYENRMNGTNLSKDFDMRTESNDVFGIKRNRMNSDLILKQLQTDIFFQGRNFEGHQTTRNYRTHSFEDERSLLAYRRRCKSEFTNFD